jgi:leucyl-tRNA synthetase
LIDKGLLLILPLFYKKIHCMDYNFNEIEKKWRKYWSENKTFKAETDKSHPKYYVLDMFPYPSGAGLHVGHPLGYIASDIFSRYKRLKGFNVLHPMGYDAYGLPAEQYAIQTGQHPAITTEKNINRYREQLDQMGFSFDWSREVRTSDPAYYKWTQWTFIKLFHSWYNQKTGIENLVKEFEKTGSKQIEAANSLQKHFTAEEWKKSTEKQQQEILMNYRLAYLADTLVNWCPALGTVLANDEVSEGFSVRGGHPVVRKSMKQWLLRITAYAERLLTGLDNIDWPEPLKEIQRNWIGRSEGAMVEFNIKNSVLKLQIFTTRPDTIFGATYMTLAPEHEFVDLITHPDQREAVEAYVTEAKNRTERERMAEVDRITGVFTGSYAIHPFTGKEMPIWIGDYVLAGYGTGAVMAVPAHDSRDYAFAKHFNLEIIEVVSGGDISVESYDAKQGTIINSDFINGMNVADAQKKVIEAFISKGIGYSKINYRLRDAIFSRQRYWGEPFPVYYKDGMPYTLDESELPLELPAVDAYLPTESGEPPLARAKNWVTKDGFPLETNTMPGFAGSSGYYMRYMDPHNDKEYFSKEANKYWENVDLYIGGAEHATGHLIYSRFWNKFLFDLGLACKDEPFKKLINQGMIHGRSSVIYRIIKFCTGDCSDNSVEMLNSVPELFMSKRIYIRLKKSIEDGKIDKEIKDEIDRIGKEQTELLKEKFPENNVTVTYEINNITKRHVPIELTEFTAMDSEILAVLDVTGLRQYQAEFFNAIFISEKDGTFLCSAEVEKMSKSFLNVVNPDDLIEKYGADTLRLYEMFLGPIEQHKPWDTKGIEGVFRFIRKLWRLYHDHENNFCVSDEEPTAEELKILHKTIKKIQEDIERLSFNTSVSAFMICVNELTELKCNKKSVLSDLAIIVSPFAPHIAEELWYLLGNDTSISKAAFPVYEEKYLVENNFSYPVSVNGKMRFLMNLPADMPVPEIQEAVSKAPELQKWIEGKEVKKYIIVPQKIINVVI